LETKRLYAKQKTPARERSCLRPPSANRIWEGRCWRELMWIVILIAAPHDRFFLDGRAEDNANRKGLLQATPCGDQTGRCRMEYALMQCSFGSRSGTSGVETCGASRSWTDDAIPLAFRVQGAPTGVCKLHHTDHQSFFTSRLDHVPHRLRLA
jgi:hypothetical protein